MRRIERIPIFLELISGRLLDIFDNVWKIGEHINYDALLDIYDINEISNFWTVRQDLRFSQVLVNLAIIPNVPGFWYYMEEHDILDELGIDRREYLLWGQNYDKDMSRLPEIIYKPIKDLNTDHIKAILDGGWCKNGPHFDCFKSELKRRKDDEQRI